MIEGIKDTHLENHCQSCKSDEDLSVNEELSLYEVILKYRVRLGGLIPTEEGFIEFYESTQKFITLCRNCKTLKEIRKFLDASKSIHHSDKTSSLEFTKQTKSTGEGKSRQLYKDIIKRDVKGRFKPILTRWLTMARSNLLHFGKPENVDEKLVEKKNENKQADEMSADSN